MPDIADSFPTIGRGHPFFQHVHRFKSLVVADHVRRRVLEEMRGNVTGHVYASLSARFSREYGWELKRVCWSWQFRDGSNPFRLQALTIFYSVASGEIDSHVFPADPGLQSMAPYFTNHVIQRMRKDVDPGVEVLRYIPRRRLTFRVLDGAGQPAIGKFVRRSQIKTTYERLVGVSAAASKSPSCFSVPSPLGVEENEGLFFQEAKPGTALTAKITEANVAELLQQAGRIHQHLHRLSVEAPEWDFMVFLEDLSAAIEWVELFRADQEPFLHRVRELLLRNCPNVETSEFTYCHGDFSCPQVLNEAGLWAVVDFDRSMRADPHWEIAKFIALLKYDVPLLRKSFVGEEDSNGGLLKRAIAAYVDGYEQAAGQTLNRERLLWYRIGAEIQYLARLLKRDLWFPLAFDRGINLIRDLCARFEG